MTLLYKITLKEGSYEIMDKLLPTAIQCPVCKNDFWIVWGKDDVLKLSKSCMCKDQMPKSDKK